MRHLAASVERSSSYVRESFVTKDRDKAAALTFNKKAMKCHGRTAAIVTDGLCSYGAALKEIGAADRQEVGRWLNNRAENSHLPFRRRERAMLRFWRMKTLQKFASVRGSVHNHFNQERHPVSREIYSVPSNIGTLIYGGWPRSRRSQCQLRVRIGHAPVRTLGRRPMLHLPPPPVAVMISAGVMRLSSDGHWN